MKERIQKVLAAAGVASRRRVEEMVRDGRIEVNGQVILELPLLVDPQRDRISVDGETVRAGKTDDGPRIYLIMNKPKGVYSTNVAQGDQVRAIDLLPPSFSKRVYPVGRLDADSKGLLLLTNDGELTNRLTHPRYGVAKTYRAVVDGRVAGDAVERLQKGVWLADREKGGFRTGGSRIHVERRFGDRSVLEITIREGRNRQVRRMLAKLGHKVRDLTRVKMGPLTLHGLSVGQVRSLTAREVKELKKLPDKAIVRRERAEKDPTDKTPPIPRGATAPGGRPRQPKLSSLSNGKRAARNA
jgi:23S rRNA pseudouridine2605 synthase